MSARVTDTERQLHDLLASLNVVLWRAEPGERRFTFVSDHAEALFGFPVERWLDERGFWLARLHPADRDLVLSREREAVARGADYEIAYRMLAADGRAVGVWDVVRVAVDGDGRPVELRGVTIAVTARLPGSVAFELSSLLTTILGYAEMLLLQTPAADERRRDLDRVREAAERAAGLLRPPAGPGRDAPTAPRPLDVCDTVCSLEPALRHVLPEGAALIVTTAAAVPFAFASAEPFEQCLQALVDDAAREADRGGTVLVEVGAVRLDQTFARRRGGVRGGKYVVVAVTPVASDGGRKTGGRVGLPGVLGIARRRGWGVWTYEAGGLGTTVKLYLPAASAPAGPEGTQPQVAPDATVLLAEADRSLREQVRRALATLGAATLEARDGLDAFRVATRHDGRIDLLVVDMDLPRIGGAEVARRLVAARPGLRVLYLSGYSETALRLAGRLETGAHVFEKPFSLDALVQRTVPLLPPTPAS